MGIKDFVDGLVANPESNIISQEEWDREYGSKPDPTTCVGTGRSHDWYATVRSVRFTQYRIGVIGTTFVSVTKGHSTSGEASVVKLQCRACDAVPPAWLAAEVREYFGEVEGL